MELDSRNLKLSALLIFNVCVIQRLLTINILIKYQHYLYSYIKNILVYQNYKTIKKVLKIL